MVGKNLAHKFSLMLIFLLSFAFQTAYSLSFKVSSSQNTDFQHKHIEKSSAKEETSGSSFLEKETENDNELDHEILAFTIAHLVFQFESIAFEHLPVNDCSLPVLNNSNIFISIRNLRI